jgi:hypothetical protein
MAKVQTRRSISINGQLFAKLRQHCQARGVAMSAYVTELLQRELEPKYRGQGTVTGRFSSATPNLANKPREARDPKSTPATPGRNDPSKIFTF